MARNGEIAATDCDILGHPLRASSPYKRPIKRVTPRPDLLFRDLVADRGSWCCGRSIFNPSLQLVNKLSYTHRKRERRESIFKERKREYIWIYPIRRYGISKARIATLIQFLKEKGVAPSLHEIYHHSHENLETVFPFIKIHGRCNSLLSSLESPPVWRIACFSFLERVCVCVCVYIHMITREWKYQRAILISKDS